MIDSDAPSVGHRPAPSSATGALDKMTAALGDGLVEYRLPVGEAELPIGPGRRLRLRAHGEVHCLACGRVSKKSYSQGHCYPCSQRLARCDLCIVRPETCHFQAGTCREPDWAQAHCFTDHVVYLANASGLKVGITRASQIPTRWIDQGAVQALPILHARDRHAAGLAEVALKAHVADRTDWRAMLRADPEPRDLAAEAARLLDLAAEALAPLRDEGAVGPVEGARETQIRYPVARHPEKVRPLNLDKTPEIAGEILGIKGQYLILEAGVLNIRKFGGYFVDVEID